MGVKCRICIYLSCYTISNTGEALLSLLQFILQIIDLQLLWIKVLYLGIFGGQFSNFTIYSRIEITFVFWQIKAQKFKIQNEKIETKEFKTTRSRQKKTAELCKICILMKKRKDLDQKSVGNFEYAKRRFFFDICSVGLTFLHNNEENLKCHKWTYISNGKFAAQKLIESIVWNWTTKFRFKKIDQLYFGEDRICSCISKKCLFYLNSRKLQLRSTQSR